MYFETSDFKERTSAANASDLDTEKKQQLGTVTKLAVKNFIVLDQCLDSFLKIFGQLFEFFEDSTMKKKCYGKMKRQFY